MMGLHRARHYLSRVRNERYCRMRAEGQDLYSRSTAQRKPKSQSPWTVGDSETIRVLTMMCGRLPADLVRVRGVRRGGAGFSHAGGQRHFDRNAPPPSLPHLAPFRSKRPKHENRTPSPNAVCVKFRRRYIKLICYLQSLLVDFGP